MYTHIVYMYMYVNIYMYVHTYTYTHIYEQKTYLACIIGFTQFE